MVYYYVRIFYSSEIQRNRLVWNTRTHQCSCVYLFHLRVCKLCSGQQTETARVKVFQYKIGVTGSALSVRMYVLVNRSEYVHTGT